MDPRVATLVDYPTMGLPHGHTYRPLRRTRWAGPRRRLPQDAAIVSIPRTSDEGQQHTKTGQVRVWR